MINIYVGEGVGHCYASKNDNEEVEIDLTMRLLRVKITKMNEWKTYEAETENEKWKNRNDKIAWERMGLGQDSWPEL